MINMTNKQLKYVYDKVCDKKKKHRSKWAAERQIREDIAKGRYEEGDKHPYLCPFEDCNSWHVGG